MKTKPVLFLFILFFFINCNDDAVRRTGMIRYIDLEGGFYGIIADNGKNYLPENLNAEFRKDSLRIAFEGVVTNKPSIQMWGTTIYLKQIRLLQ